MLWLWLVIGARQTHGLSALVGPVAGLCMMPEQDMLSCIVQGAVLTARAAHQSMVHDLGIWHGLLHEESILTQMAYKKPRRAMLNVLLHLSAVV